MTDEIQIVEEISSVELVEEGIAALEVQSGPTGPAGLSALTFRAVAAVDLSSNCLVSTRADGQLIRADGPAGIPAQGLVRSATVAGLECRVERTGLVNGFSGLVPPSTLFCGSAGQPVATPPSSGIVQAVGEVISSSTMLLSVLGPIELV